MYNVAKLNDETRDQIFSKYAYEYGNNKAIVEKDFWVTLVLDYLFHKCEYKDYFIFKGGTSLSKCFNLINRFSEDIDLILRWDLLTDDDPNKERSKTKQDIYNKNINSLAAEFILNELKPVMEKDIKNLLDREIKIEVSEDEPQVLNFYYPRIYDDKNSGILKYVRLEIGPLAALTPVEGVMITPLITSLNLKIYKNMNTVITTVSPERTFWEKILILNQEANRPMNKKMLPRYSRHYYDVYKISLSIYKGKAYSNLDLLTKVREFKKKFYPSGWANYDSAIPGQFKLIPNKERIKESKEDFENMKEMINDDSITFEKLMEEIQKIETEINNLK